MKTNILLGILASSRSQPVIDTGITLSDTSLSFDSSAGNKSVAMTIKPIGSDWWTIDGAAWLTSSPNSGSGDASINISVLKQNINDLSRNSYVDVSSATDIKRISVSQASGPVPNLSISPIYQLVDKNGDTIFLDINSTPSEIVWTVKNRNNDAWISIGDPSGTSHGSSAISITAQTPGDPSRDGYIDVSTAYQVKTLHIEQEAAPIILPELQIRPSNGITGIGSFANTANFTWAYNDPFNGMQPCGPHFIEVSTNGPWTTNELGDGANFFSIQPHEGIAGVHQVEIIQNGNLGNGDNVQYEFLMDGNWKANAWVNVVEVCPPID